MVMLSAIPCLTLHSHYTTLHIFFRLHFECSQFPFFYSVCSVSVVSDGVLHCCKSLYIILLWWFCVVWSRNGKVKPGRIEKRGIEIKKELQVKPVTLFALQDGLEPTTPWLTVRCSNQLSYWSVFSAKNVTFLICVCKSTNFSSFCQIFPQLFLLFL